MQWDEWEKDQETDRRRKNQNHQKRWLGKKSNSFSSNAMKMNTVVESYLAKSEETNYLTISLSHYYLALFFRKKITLWQTLKWLGTNTHEPLFSLLVHHTCAIYHRRRNKQGKFDNFGTRLKLDHLVLLIDFVIQSTTSAWASGSDKLFEYVAR